MKLENEKISIIIPCYNVAPYLHQCLDSIITQKYRNLEIIVVNDGSTDDTLEIINEFAEKDFRIKFINQENKGLSETRNIGLDLASGDYVMFVDSDDWIGADYFSSFVSHIDQEIDLVIGAYTREFKNRSVERNLNLSGMYRAEEIQRRLIGLIGSELADPSQADSIVTLWSKLYRLDIIKAHKIKFEEIEKIGTAEDLLFNLYYTAYCREIYIVNEPLYHYRKTNLNSFTTLYKKDLFPKWGNLFGYIKPFCDTATKEQAFYNRICLSIIGLGLTEMKNPKGRKEVFENLKLFLSDPLYREAFSKLELRYFPFYWKLFFSCAKRRYILPLYWLLKIIDKIINKNN